jgi:hypothetical protein
MNEEEAFNKAIGNLGSKSELKKIFNFKSLENMNFEYNMNKTFAAIATVVYMILGFVFDLWHPGWVVFLFAIAFSDFNYKDKKNYYLPVMIIVYTFVGFMWDLWHPGWIIFPIGFLIIATMNKKYGSMLLMTGAIYAILGLLFGYWLLFSLIFILATGLIAGRDEIIAGMWIFTIAIYLFLGIMFDLWHPGWLVFLVSVLITTIIEEKSLNGFIWIASITSYLFLGFVFSLWHPTWIVFIVAAAISTYFDEDTKILSVEVKQNKDIMNKEEL